MTDQHTIVVVEDSFVGNFLKAVLERRGYRVMPASREDALNLLDCRSPAVALLITNTPRVFVDFGDRIPLLYTAAFPDPVNTAGWRRWMSLRKPFQTSELLRCVERLLASV